MHLDMPEPVIHIERRVSHRDNQTGHDRTGAGQGVIDPLKALATIKEGQEAMGPLGLA